MDHPTSGVLVLRPDLLQESPGPPGPKSQKSLEKSLFGGPQKSPKKYAKESKNTRKGPENWYFLTFRVFFGAFLQTPKKTLFETFLRFRAGRVRRLPIGCDTPSPFLSISPLESMRSGGAIPPPQRGYLSDTCAIPCENKANRCDTPLCDTPREARDLISKIRSCAVRSDLENRHFLLILCLFLRSDLTAQDRILEIRVLASLGYLERVLRDMGGLSRTGPLSSQQVGFSSTLAC